MVSIALWKSQRVSWQLGNPFWGLTSRTNFRAPPGKGKVIYVISIPDEEFFLYNVRWLVGGLEHFLLFHRLGIVIPTDFHIFQRGWNHQTVTLLMCLWKGYNLISILFPCWKTLGICALFNSWLFFAPWDPKNLQEDEAPFFCFFDVRSTGFWPIATEIWYHTGPYIFLLDILHRYCLILPHLSYPPYIYISYHILSYMFLAEKYVATILEVIYVNSQATATGWSRWGVAPIISNQ